MVPDFGKLAEGLVWMGAIVSLTLCFGGLFVGWLIWG